MADHVGSTIAALSVEPVGSGLRGRLRLIGLESAPATARPLIPGATLTACGPGCWDLGLARQPASISVSLAEKGRLYSARLPLRWMASSDGWAGRLLARAQATMRHLASVREQERVTSGPGSLAATVYRLKAPDRFTYTTNFHVRAIVLGEREWFQDGAGQPWRLTQYGGGPPGFRTRSWFRYTVYAESVRLLKISQRGRRRVAELALMDPATPVWFRLRVDLRDMRVVEERMIAPGHFMTRRYSDFNRPALIEPPRGR